MVRLRSPSRSSPRLLYHQESPVRQVEIDLERQFKHIQLHDEEQQKVYIYNRKLLQNELDAKEHAQAAVHKADLDQVLAKHEVIRQQAVAVLEAHKAEAARKAAEVKAKAEREEEERKQREEEAVRQAKAKADADTAIKRRQEEENVKTDAEKAGSAKAAASEPLGSPSDSHLPWSSDPEVRHKHYLSIHRHLKTFRRNFLQSAKANPTLKGIPGEMRRTIKTAVGQLTISDKKANNAATDKIRGCINRALNEIASQPAPLNDYLPPHLAVDEENGTTTTIPSLLIYVINIFSKALFEAFTGECSVNTAAADPLGTMAAQIFSGTELQYPRNIRPRGSQPTLPSHPLSVSLISILIAKFHATAPILFGISGNETTQQGRARLGWRKQDGNFVLPQVQYDRLIGIAAGYASISLRNFAKAPNKINPYPPRHFWTSLAHILNTPSAQVQTPHVLLLKTLLDVGLDRFILFFGSDAVVVLRQAVVNLPKTLLPEVTSKAEVKSLSLLQEKWKREKNFTLTLT
ncbi:hypothetical protein DV736_g2912, partial [Chaetothyriales sp. CBS 134916]